MTRETQGDYRRPKFVYIACPYTQGDQFDNVATCLHAAETLIQHGYVPFVPLLYAFWNFRYPHQWEVWMWLCMEWLSKCDTVIRLPGDSRGADMEVKAAAERGIPVYQGLEAFLDAKRNA